MSDEKTYTVPVKFVFEGKFFIKAGSQEEADKIAEDSCGMTTGGIHSALCDDIVNWEFPKHSDKIVGGEDE